jgi:hypothetical protein
VNWHKRTKSIDGTRNADRKGPEEGCDTIRVYDRYLTSSLYWIQLKIVLDYGIVIGTRINIEDMDEVLIERLNASLNQSINDGRKMSRIGQDRG